MATKDFKIRHSLTVAENATIEGNLTLGGNTVSRLIDSDYVTTTINSNANEVEVFTVTLDSDVGSIGSPSMGDVAFVPYRNVSGRGVQDTSVTITGGTLYANGLYQFAGNATNKGNLEVGDVMIGRTTPDTGDKAWVVYSLGNNADEILVAALDSEQILEVWVNDLRTNHTTVPITPTVTSANDPMLTDPAPKFYSGWTSVSNVPGSNPAVTTGVTLSGSAGGITHFMPKAYIHDSDGFDIELIVEGTDAYPEHKVMRRQDVFDSDQIVAIINENTNAGSIDSDVAAVAALRRDADSDSIRIQEIATELEGINQVVDSDLKAIADLRNDLDSESLEIRALRKDIDSDEQAIQAIKTDMDVSFNIVNNGASAYTFSGDGFPSGVDNPTLYLNRGQTYNFRVNASGHPFEIRLSNGGSAYSSGVTNNAAQIGEVKFVVPMDAPETLVYQCTVHSGMVGTIKIGKQGFDSDQIASMILENGSGSGMTDSDLAVVAKLRADVDSDSIKLQALEETVAGLSASSGFDSDQVVAIINENPTSSGTGMTDSDLKVVADLRNDVDSDSIKLQALQETVAGLSGGGGSGMTDSDLKVVADLRNDLDSELRASRTTLSISRFDYTATQGQTLFSGADDNGNTLSYVSSKIQVFLNGILLLDNTDYTANNDTSLTLTVAADSDDKISIIKYLGVAAEAINITRFTYKYGVDGNGIVGDSDITGNDEHGNTLSYTAGKIQVYSNGILLEDSDDYIATDGSTITLRAAPDSDDVVSIFKYLGTIQSGFDSEQVVSIVNENSSGVTTGKAIAMAIVFGG